MNIVLLVSLLRPVLWLVGVYVAITYCNWFAMIGSFLAAIASVPIAFELADYSVPQWLLQVSSIISTPAVMFIVAAMMWSARNYKNMRDFLEKEVPHWVDKTD